MEVGTFGLILSVFAVIALGAALGRIRLIGDDGVKGLNAFVWHVAVPALLFKVMSSQSLPGADDLLLVGAYYGTAFTVYVLFMLAAGLIFGLSAMERPVLALGGCFANGMMIGVPIIGGAYGEEGLRLLFLLLAFHGPLFITTTTLLVETARNKHSSVVKTFGRSIVSLSRQTPLIALALGLIASGVGFKTPAVAAKILDMLGSTVAPVGLFAVGASLAHVRIQGHLPQSGLAAFVKLLVMPTAMLATTGLLGIDPAWRAVAVTMAGLPTGIVAYNVAAGLDVAPKRNASTILFANIAAIATLSFWLQYLS